MDRLKRRKWPELGYATAGRQGSGKTGSVKTTNFTPNAGKKKIKKNSSNHVVMTAPQTGIPITSRVRTWRYIRPRVRDERSGTEQFHRHARRGDNPINSV